LYNLEYSKVKYMQTEFYRDSLKDALKNLVEVNSMIYNSLIPLAMTGELKDWSNSVPIGEVHNFAFDLFRNCEDTNIQHLVKLIETVDATYNTIKNLNAIEMEEDEE
jgi:hypothetical protein